MHPSLKKTDHRPWPLPGTSWTWRQSWNELLFAHWPVPASQLESLVPDDLEVEEFNGTSWVGVVPFRMEHVMRRPLPDLPWLSAFPEVNLRLYVRHQDKPGVWFLSLDAPNPVAVWAARRFFHLPYFRSSMTMTEGNGTIAIDSVRGGEGIEFSARYRAKGPLDEPKPGSLEHWLTERYCLYAQSPNGALWRTDVHHHPWPLHLAEGEFPRNDLGRPFGLDLEGPPALLHYSPGVDVVAWSPVLIAPPESFVTLPNGPSG